MLAQAVAHPPLDPPLRGRDAELLVVGRHLDALTQGHGGVVLLDGLGGAGKTRILAAAAATAEKLGVRVGAGAGDPIAGAAPLTSLLEAIVGGKRPLVDPSTLREPRADADRRFWVVREIEERLRQAARQQPVLICLDDAQWADAATLAALRTLTARLAEEPVAWLVAAATEERPAPLRAVWSRLHDAGATVVGLRELDTEAVAALACDVLGCPPDPGVVELTCAVADRPALAVALLRGLTEEEALRVGSDGLARLTQRELPARFTRSVGQRLAELGHGVSELVRLVAVLDRPMGLKSLAVLLGRPCAALHAPLATAIRAGLLEDEEGAVGVRRTLIADAVQAAVAPATTRVLRRRAADVLLDDGATAADVAPLLVASAQPGDRGAIATLRTAAAQLAHSEPATAAGFSVHALTLTDVTWPGRPALVVETASVLWRSGRAEDARRLAREALTCPLDDEAEAGIRLALAAASEEHAFADAADQARLGLDLPGTPPTLRRALLTTLGRALVAAGEHGGARAAAEAAAASARADRDVGAEASALAIVAACDAAHGDLHVALANATTAVDLATATDDAAAYVPGHAAHQRALLWSTTGRTGDALTEVDRGTRAAQRRGDAPALRRWGAARARILLDAGRLDEARSAAEAVLATGEAGDVSDATAAWVLATLAIRTGDRDGLRDAEDAVARMTAHGAPAVRTTGQWLAVLLADAHGDAGTASSGLDEIFATLGADDPALPAPLDPADLPALARIALAAGDRRRASLALRAADRLAVDPAATPLHAAIARHVRGLVDGDPSSAAQAAALLADTERVLVRAAALESHGDLLAAQGREDARRPLDAALRLYEQTGAERDAARVRLRLRGIGVRRRRPEEATEGWAGLTPAELQVARLVADGATNREVAARLFVSPHTVSTHLRHAFAKLGIRSRVDLARMAATALFPAPNTIPVRSS